MKRKLNVNLLRKIQAHITEEPRRFFMNWFVERAWPNQIYFMSDNGTMQKFAPCKTAACIAGWANLLTGGIDAADHRRAAKKLGVESYSIGFHPLFDRSGWPEQFFSRYNRARTPRTRAKIACERIDHLIETGE